MTRNGLAAALLAALATLAAADTGFEAERAALLAQIEAVHGFDAGQMAALRAVFAGAPYLGQGNPDIVEHPMTPEQCRAKLADAGIDYANPQFERICGGK